MTDQFSLRCRVEGGGTPELQQWGADCEYGVLTDVLLGPADNYEWLKTSSVSKKSIRRKLKFDAQTAQQQHREMVSAYESAGVTCHFHEPDPALPYQVFARDSSVMTPFGAIITSMANWWRRGENYRAIETYERLDWLKSKQIEIIAVPFKDTLDLGCNVVALGNDRILLPEKSTVLKEKARAHGLEIFDPDVSMITPGGGGVHCMCQALRRLPG